MSDISDMGLMMLCKFEYNNDAHFATTAINNGDGDGEEKGLASSPCR
jgi:hypothetical protein